MSHKVTLIPGDGTGPELVEATRRVLEATGVEFEWDYQEAGIKSFEKEGTPLPEAVLESIRHNKVALKGPMTTQLGKGFRSANVALRQKLDLYVNLRPARSYAGIRSRYEGLDLLVVRENTEGLYSGVEHWVGKDAAETIRIITRKGCERVIGFAFEYARANGRKKVTAVHKANVLKLTGGLFLEVFYQIAEGYSDIEAEDRIVDNMSMQLVQKPELYDVMVCPNLFGDIISDLCAGLVGGLGLAPGANIGDELAVFEPVHGSAPKYAGQNKVNPTATIFSGIMMLQHLGEAEAAERTQKAVEEVIAEGDSVTYDLKPTRDDPTAAGTAEMADAIIEKMRA